MIIESYLFTNGCPSQPEAHDATIEKILMWQPDIVFTAGPPLYLQTLSGPLRKRAWLDNLSQIVGQKVYCAADFMNKPRLLLVARRTILYQEIPVLENRHQDYQEGKVLMEKFNTES